MQDLNELNFSNLLTLMNSFSLFVCLTDICVQTFGYRHLHTSRQSRWTCDCPSVMQPYISHKTITMGCTWRAIRVDQGQAIISSRNFWISQVSYQASCTEGFGGLEVRSKVKSNLSDISNLNYDLSINFIYSKQWDLQVNLFAKDILVEAVKLQRMEMK